MSRRTDLFKAEPGFVNRAGGSPWEKYSFRISKTPHMANPLNAMIISAPDSSATCLISEDSS